MFGVMCSTTAVSAEVKQPMSFKVAPAGSSNDIMLIQLQDQLQNLRACQESNFTIKLSATGATACTGASDTHHRLEL